MMFNKIAAVDNLSLTEETFEKLKNYGKEVIFYSSNIKNDYEIIKNIRDADCLLVSWDTVINKNVIESCKSLKYIGMCCSLFEGKSSNVDVNAARENGIIVTGVNGYGDNVAEFVISQLIGLLHGYGGKQWKKQEHELQGQKIGIIGAGATGSILARALKYMGADVYYYSRSKKEEFDAKYLDFDELLKAVDIISTHLPQSIYILNEEKLKLFGNNKIIVNTSIGPTYIYEDMLEWLENKDNYLVVDQVGAGNHKEELARKENVLYTDKVSAKTAEMDMRLSASVLRNIENVLEQLKDAVRLQR